MAEIPPRFTAAIVEELVYNILYVKGSPAYSLSSKELANEFQRKIGIESIVGDSSDLIIADKKWPEFLKEAIGLRAVPLVGLNADEDFIIGLDTESKEFEFCKEYHSRDLISTDSNCKLTIAQYREMLLIGAYKLVKKSRSGNINRTDGNGNTLLHFIAALPGIGGENLEFVKLLLDNGSQVLKKNKDDLTPLHIIAGRIQVSGEGESFIFQRERISSKSWNIDYRKNVLDLLSSKPKSTTIMAQGSGRDGNTVIHEWVLSTDGEELEQEDPEFEFAKKLTHLVTKPGSKPDTPNNHGLYPLHLASSFIVFQFLISIGCSYRQRNEHDDTPFLFMLKYIVALALVHTNMSTPKVAEEIQSFLDENITQVCKKQSLEKAIFVLEQLIQLTTSTGTPDSDTQDTVWLADKDRVSVLEVVLVCIRVTSYRLMSHLGTKPNEDYAKHVENTKNLQKVFVKFLQHILKIGDADYNLRYRNKKGQGPLHVLLASSGTNDLEFNAEPIIECVNILIQHGVNVNAKDDGNRKPLDIANLYHDQFPELYDECIEILIANGAVLNSSKVPAVRIVQTFSHQHETSLQQLATTTENVTVVEKKYHYFPDKVIGTGSFSSTYVALKDEHKDEKSGKIICRAIVLKRVDKGRSSSHAVKREIKALISPSSQCKNIVDYIETIEDPSFYYICLELMDGDLKNFISNHDMAMKGLHKPAILVQAAHDIVSGLMFLHEQDFLHRDLKPGNVLYLVNENDQLCFKISDFGLAKDVSALHGMSSTSSSGTGTPGTLSWMAPELVSGRSPKHTKESDVFALGLVLYYLFTMGIHPYSGPKDERGHLPHKIQNNLEKGNKFLHSSLSPEAKRFFEVVLEENAKARPTAKCVGELPFLWTQTKKIEFLRSVGDQDEAASPLKKHPNSSMEQCLQSTEIGEIVTGHQWNSTIPKLYFAMVSAGKRSSYRGDMVIDLLRFLRNAYAHKEENPTVISSLQSNVFLQKFPSLVIDVYEALEKNGFLKSRANIAEVLSKKYV